MPYRYVTVLDDDTVENTQNKPRHDPVPEATSMDHNSHHQVVEYNIQKISCAVLRKNIVPC